MNFVVIKKLLRFKLPRLLQEVSIHKIKNLIGTYVVFLTGEWLLYTYCIPNIGELGYGEYIDRVSKIMKAFSGFFFNAKFTTVTCIHTL